MSNDGIPWILFVVLGATLLVTTLVTLFLLLRAQHRKARQQVWIQLHGLPGTARILSVSDTRIRDSHDYFVLDFTVDMVSVCSGPTRRSFRTSVSPLHFHRLEPGREIRVRQHPHTGELALEPDAPPTSWHTSP